MTGARRLPRDEASTHRWLGNLLLSPILYVCAGLVLNLEARGRGLGLAFTRASWPWPESRRASLWLAAAAHPLLALAAFVLVGFVGWRLPGGR